MNKIKIDWGKVLGILGVAAIGAIQAVWQAKLDQDLMEDTVRTTIAQITEEEGE